MPGGPSLEDTIRAEDASFPPRPRSNSRSIENLPEVTTMGVAWQPEGGPAWLYQPTTPPDQWVPVSGGGGTGVPEAPNDGNAYLRSNNSWTSGGTLTGALSGTTAAFTGEVSALTPTQPNSVATKQYVDAAIAGGGEFVDAPTDGHSYMRADGTWVSGGLLSNALTLNNDLIISRPSATPKAIFGQTDGVNRWKISLGGTVAETGGNVGADLYISRFDDAGTLVGNPLMINRATGQVSFSQPTIHQALPSFPGGTSGQVLSTDGAGTLSWITPSAGGGDFLPLTGGILSGPLTIAPPSPPFGTTVLTITGNGGYAATINEQASNAQGAPTFSFTNNKLNGIGGFGSALSICNQRAGYVQFINQDQGTAGQVRYGPEVGFASVNTGQGLHWYSTSAATTLNASLRGDYASNRIMITGSNVASPIQAWNYNNLTSTFFAIPSIPGGSAGQFLSTDGAGTLSWADAGGGSGGGIPEPTNPGNFLRNNAGAWIDGLPLTGGAVTGDTSFTGANGISTNFINCLPATNLVVRAGATNQINAITVNQGTGQITFGSTATSYAVKIPDQPGATFGIPQLVVTGNNSAGLGGGNNNLNLTTGRNNHVIITNQDNLIIGIFMPYYGFVTTNDGYGMNWATGGAGTPVYQACMELNVAAHSIELKNGAQTQLIQSWNYNDFSTTFYGVVNMPAGFNGNNARATAPPNPTVGMTWYDTTADALKVYTTRRRWRTLR